MSPIREALRGDPNRASLLVFVLAAAVSAVMVLVYARGTTFALDEWRFVFEDSEAQLYLVVPPGGLAYAQQRGPAPSLALRRFGSRFTVEVAAPRGAARVEIPSDSSRQPWIAQLKSSLPVTTCALR